MHTLRIFLSSLLLVSSMTFADTAAIKPFGSGSYQQILQAHDKQAFMLILWSLDCPTCIKDMELLNHIHKSRPELTIVMIATDELSASSEIQTLLSKYQLSDLENWVFADDNSQKLRYEIDPGWYSELPRTYFFSANHQREGVSGALTLEQYQARFVKLKI
ncbi:MAG: hypothetical protein EBR59_09260 [Methylococcaceae bacterium]|nr:hypothetical protein [Methylococcaceae bacterium]